MPTIAEYLKFANLQMAAEALYDFKAASIDPEQPPPVLDPGAKAFGTIPTAVLTDGNLHASRFAATEATKFAGLWEVVEHISNTTTGFSGTLFKAKETRADLGITVNELVLSFRSTEFIDDAARDNEATNKLEISEKGFAFGQISDMEGWYADLSKAGGPLAGKQVSVTGYSLGGHLATAFNLMHPGVATQVINFNGAGLGTIGDGSRATMQSQLPQMIQYFADLRDQAGQGTGLEGIFLSDFGRQAYRALRTAIKAALDSAMGVLPETADSLLAVLTQQQGNQVLGVTELYDFDLLKKAIEAAVQVTAKAHSVGNLNSGGAPKVPANPAKIPDLAPDGTLAIAGESLDYQLAVFLTQKQFNTKPLPLSDGISAALGKPTPALGGALENQWDVAATETSTPPWYMVAYSQYRYGNDVKLFIEDQPFKRGNVLEKTIEALLAGEIELLHPEYVKNDFGDTHSLALIVDSLNVQNALLQLLPNADRANTAGTLDTVLKNASWRKAEINSGQGNAEGDVLENVVNTLAEFVLGPQSKADRLNGSPVGNTWWDWENSTVNGTLFTGRDEFYAKLNAITGSETYKALAGRLALAPSSAALKDSARNDFGAYAALYSLSPFTFSANPAVLMLAFDGADNPIYAAWQADKDAQAAGTPVEQLAISEAWLADRAAMLAFKNGFNNQNIAPYNPAATEGTGDSVSPKIAPIYFEDIASGYKIQQGSLDGGTAERFIFGDDTDNPDITGGRYADHLYGGAGNDTLNGGAGNDRLEGGVGDDLYLLTSNDGNDIILDSDGKGGIRLDGTPLTGGDSVLPGKWSRGGISYQFNPDDTGRGRLLISSAAGTTTVENFAAGELGIELPGAPTPPVMRTLIGTDLHDAIYDFIEGGALSNDLIQGLGGNDVIGAHYGGDDRIEGGEGNDWLGGGDGNDIVIGGPGRDSLIEGAGNDRLYADELISPRAALAAQNGAASGAVGDALSGGAGDDLLIGNADHNVLLGGPGSDLLIGGPGDDTIDADILGKGMWDIPQVRREIVEESPGNIRRFAHFENMTIDYATAGGDDVIFGGAGADWLFGSYGKDYVDGGIDNDVLSGGRGADEVYGDSGNDVLWGDLEMKQGGESHTDANNSPQAGDDLLDGGEGDDELAGHGGNDQLFGGKDNDLLDGGRGNDRLFGGDGADRLVGDGDYVASEFHGDDLLDAGTGDDTLYGNGGNDTLIGGAGVDYLDGGAGNDTYLLAVGESALGTSTVETIKDISGTDTLRLGPGIKLADLRLGRVGAKDLLLEYGQDHIVVQGGLTGALERLEFADGSSQSWAKLVGAKLGEVVSLAVTGSGATVQGGNQADTLTARDGGAQVAGGGGNDRITVLGNNNTIFYARGDGTDRIVTSSPMAGNNNVLRLSGVGAGSLKLGLGSLAIQVGDDANDVLHFESFDRADVHARSPFERIEFDDGSVLDYEELMARGFDLAGSDGADVIGGTNVSDRIGGGAGNDSLSGGRGNDIYYFARGDGEDTIHDWADTPSSVNTVEFGPGITLSDLVFDRSADGSLHIGFADSSDAVSLPGWYRANNPTRSIQQLAFEDGSRFDTVALDGLAISPIRGTAGDDALAGTRFDDVIMGLAGNDVIDGSYGDDVLIGGTGADSYVFAWETVSWWDQNGADTIIEADGESSTLLLQRGMSLDLFRAERLNDDLRFRVRGGEHSVLIKDYFATNQQWSIRAHDGSVTSMSDFLARPDPDSGDLLREAWNDFNSAARWEWNTWHQRSYINWELLADGRYRRTETFAGADATVSTKTTYSTEYRWAADGSMYTVETGPFEGEVRATASGGLNYSERYESFGAPLTTLDTSLYYLAQTQTNATQTQTATFQMQWTQPAYDLTSRYYQGQQRILIGYLLDEDGNFVYDEGEALIGWYEWAPTRTYEDTYRASVGGSVVSYSDGLAPGAANGADVANALKAALKGAVDAGGTGGLLHPSLPTTVTGTLSVTHSTSHLNEFHGTAANEFLYTDTFFAADAGAGDDIVISNAGSSSLAFGGDGNDKIFGAHEASDVLNGGRGDDYLGGMGGDDTYLVLRGQTGRDVIDEVVAHYSVPKPGSSWSWTEWNPDVGHGSRDTVRFGAGITLADLKFSDGLMSSRGVDAPATAAFYETLNISWAPGESIHVVLPDLSKSATIATMAANPGESFGIEWFRFDDGTMVSMDAMRQRATNAAYQMPADYGVPRFLGDSSPIVGTGGDEWLYGGTGTPNVVEGNGGDDHLYGSTLRDYLAGGAGNDYLDGGLGADILEGGDGNDTLLGTGGDTLIGGSGDDRLSTSGTGTTFVYELGDGTDVIANSGATSGNSVVFGDGIYSQDISLGLGSLLIRVKGEDAIHIEGFDPLHPYAAPTVDKFVFADGSVHTYQALLERGFDLSGSDGDDRITGTAISDRLTGGLGNDILAGGAGNDRYVYWFGDGSDYIDDAAGSNTLFIGGGVIADSLETARTGNDLVIGILGTDDTITLGNWYGSTEGVSRIEFGDGSFLDRSEMESHRNDPPVANADSITVYEDGGALSFAAANLLANDTDPNPGDVLTVIGVGTSQVGATVSLADGQIRYDIGNAFQALAEGDVVHDSFSYTITDSKGAQASSLVNVEIVGANDAPVTVADADATVEDTLQPITGNVLANDSDVDNGTVLRIAAPGDYLGAYGRLALAADGSYSYALDNPSLAVQALAQAQVAIDHFAYDVTDGIAAVGSSLDITVTGINDAPVVTDDAGLVAEDGVLSATGNALANDTDVDTGTVLQVAAPGNYLGAYGTLALAADGSFSYSLSNDSLAVQSLASGTAAVDRFAYAATDGITAVNSALDITVLGANDAPVTANDADIVVEDWRTVATGNVLANDHDVDAGTVLQVANPGTYAGEYGSLSLEADGRYTYTLDNAAAKIQSLGREAAVVEHFGYTATDGQVGTDAVLDVFLHGTNDAPVVVTPLADHDVTFNKPFSWQMPADSFKDVDTGDVLTYAATQADGSALPDWLHFDAQTLAFSGMSPKAVMSIDVRVTATDKVAATGNTTGSLSASDVFTLSSSHGNEGVGNGQDAAPAGHATNFNDGAGTSPGNPGAKGGKTSLSASMSTTAGASLASTGVAPVVPPNTPIAASMPSVSASDVSGVDSTQSQATPSAPTYLGLKDWQQYAPVATSGTVSSDEAAIFARWLAVDLAVAQALAGNGPAWLDDGLGADTAALSKATSGYLGSTRAFGTDAFSLLAGSGQNLQTFKGLAEGVQKIA